MFYYLLPFILSPFSRPLQQNYSNNKQPPLKQLIFECFYDPQNVIFECIRKWELDAHGKLFNGKRWIHNNNKKKKIWLNDDDELNWPNGVSSSFNIFNIIYGMSIIILNCLIFDPIKENAFLIIICFFFLFCIRYGDRPIQSN